METIRKLKSLLKTENSFLKKFIMESSISAKDLKELKELQEEKRKLLKEVFKAKREEINRSWKELEELSSLNLENKELLIRLIELYRRF